jgi:hypothetical protein
VRAELPGALAAVALLVVGAAAEPPFREVALERGIDFVHDQGGSGRRYAVEVMGSGGGFLDYDGDGDLDVLLLDGGPLPGTPPRAAPPRHRLLRNDGTGHFEDATEGSGLSHTGYAMGLAVGDVDADGDPDVLVTAFGPDAFFRNLGGRFEEATGEAGVADARWNSSAVFFDYDGDGDLDLYVTGYLDLDVAAHRPCLIAGVEVHCGPDSFSGIPDRLYRNDGSGRFEDVSAEAGIAGAVGKGLGVVAGDVDGDGDQDLYVANDGTANFLWVNRAESGRQGFEEQAVLFGGAYGETAAAEAGMGVDLGDYDGDGDLDVVCTNLDGETTSLYRNEAGTALTESSYAAGVGAPTLPWVGFGVRFLDYDSDGDEDLLVTQGHIMDNVAELRQGASYAQPNLLLENEAGRFRVACPDCLPMGVGRGLATGDVDGDGDTDVLITNSGGRPFLLENVAARAGSAIGVRLEGRPGSNRDAYGALVRWPAFGKTRLRLVQAGGSYASSSDPRLLLAVPADVRAQEVTIAWPSGRVERLELEAGVYSQVVEGEGVRARVAFSPSP